MLQQWDAVDGIWARVARAMLWLPELFGMLARAVLLKDEREKRETEKDRRCRMREIEIEIALVWCYGNEMGFEWEQREQCFGCLSCFGCFQELFCWERRERRESQKDLTVLFERIGSAYMQNNLNKLKACENDAWKLSIHWRNSILSSLSKKQQFLNISMANFFPFSCLSFTFSFKKDLIT